MTLLDERTAQVAPLDDAAMGEASDRWETRAKPLGSLGQLEQLAVVLSGISGKCPPPVPVRPAVAVFAGDHGVTADGASAWPAEVTELMARGMAAGGAAINVFADAASAELRLVDVAVDADISDLAAFTNRKIRRGTANLSREPAMTIAEARAGVEVGIGIADDLIRQGHDLLVGGELGIGNTTAAAALIAAFTGADPASVVGPGAGLGQDRLAHKVSLVASGLARLTPATPPLEILSEVGGLEVAALAGLYIGSAAAGVPVIVDGVIACAALLTADRLAPGTAPRCIAGHLSSEPGAKIALEYLGKTALLDLSLRLGEGTGAALAIPLVQAAAQALNTMMALPS